MCTRGRQADGPAGLIERVAVVYCGSPYLHIYAHNYVHARTHTGPHPDMCDESRLPLLLTRRRPRLQRRRLPTRPHQSSRRRSLSCFVSAQCVEDSAERDQMKKHRYMERPTHFQQYISHMHAHRAHFICADRINFLNMYYRRRPHPTLLRPRRLRRRRLSRLLPTLPSRNRKRYVHAREAGRRTKRWLYCGLHICLRTRLLA